MRSVKGRTDAWKAEACATRPAARSLHGLLLLLPARALRWLRWVLLLLLLLPARWGRVLLGRESIL